MNEKYLVDYACQCFEDGKYDEALEAFVIAYCNGYEQAWIIENIYACYMDGNETAFREAYKKQMFDSSIEYEACTLDFIPYKEGVYYIFDKKINEFRGLFSVNQLEDVERPDAFKKAEFSAIAIEFDGDWREYPELLAEAKQRKVYVVCNDMKRGMSFWKIPELEPYLKNVWMFSNMQSMQQYFHENTAIYLPKIIYGNNQVLLDVFDQEHTYRLTPEGRNEDNVLLTIAIPTMGRGNLVLERVKKLLQLEYDAELEIAISKNGSIYFEDEYQQVSQIEDERLCYYDHRKNLKYYENWRYAIEMSHGQYVLLVADEDEVRSESIEHYLKILKNNSSLAFLRARTDLQYNSFVIPHSTYKKRGIDAFQQAFLRQNYISGMIVRKEMFLKRKFYELDRFADNIFYQFYAHEWWCAALCMDGDYMEEKVSLISEGDSEFENEEQRNCLDVQNLKPDRKINGRILPEYSTYNARLEQFQGQIEFLKWFCEKDAQLMFVGLYTAIDKMRHLFMLARDYQYDLEHFEDWVDQYAKFCVSAVDDLIEEGKKQFLLQRIYDNSVELLTRHYNWLEKCGK